MRKSTISINQKANEVLIKISEDAEEEKILEELKKKVAGLRKTVQRRKNTN